MQEYSHSEVPSRDTTPHSRPDSSSGAMSGISEKLDSTPTDRVQSSENSRNLSAENGSASSHSSGSRQNSAERLRKQTPRTAGNEGSPTATSNGGAAANGFSQTPSSVGSQSQASLAAPAPAPAASTAANKLFIRAINKSTIMGTEYLVALFSLPTISVHVRLSDYTINATELLKLSLLLENNQVTTVGLSPNDRWVPLNEGATMSQENGTFELLEKLFNAAKPEELAKLDSTPGSVKVERGSNAFYKPLKQEERAATAKYLGDPVPLSPLNGSINNFEYSRDVITELFMNLSEEPSLKDILDNHGQTRAINIDVPIDESGHTALHWAAALGRITLVRDLIRHGASPRRGNFAGESPLIRAVLVTNNSDMSTFLELLDELHPALYLTDNAGRTVLHHIALTSGVKGRSDASRYYLETLLEWIVKRGHTALGGLYGLNNFISSIVDYQDNNGDTALNISARIGNKHIVQQLMEVGADVGIPNRAGLRPMDFGITLDTSMSMPSDRLAPKSRDNGNSNLSPRSAAMAAASVDQYDPEANDSVSVGNARKRGLVGPGPRVASASDKRRDLMGSIRSTIDALDKEFEQELESKQSLLNKIHQQLREATASLIMYKEHAGRINSYTETFADSQRCNAALTKAVELEDEKFKKSDPENVIDYTYDFNPDAPFKVSPNDPSLGNTPPAVLEARIKAYRENQSNLDAFKDELQKRSVTLERKFQRVVALCTGLEVSQVEGVLKGLVQAVESDSGEVNLARISGVLRRIES